MTDAAPAAPAPADTAPGADDDLRDLPDVSLDEIKAQLAELGLTPGQLKGRLIASRRWEDRAKGKDPEFLELKDKAAQYDALSDASRTEHERAVEAAKSEGKAAALQEAAPRLVRAEFRAAAKGVLTDAARDAILEDLDFSKYLTDNGEVDEAKVAAKVTALAPTQEKRPPTLLGQGRTHGDVKPSVASGAELFARSRKRSA